MKHHMEDMLVDKRQRQNYCKVGISRLPFSRTREILWSNATGVRGREICVATTNYLRNPSSRLNSLMCGE
ncbi:hypothetical protein Csa_014845 [Cucumis sativus]|nr:hypothetical protein Csa_014845 [Cucumis sativus]